jgi:hypothetical protein
MYERLELTGDIVRSHREGVESPSVRVVNDYLVRHTVFKIYNVLRGNESCNS